MNALSNDVKANLILTVYTSSVFNLFNISDNLLSIELYLEDESVDKAVKSALVGNASVCCYGTQ